MALKGQKVDMPKSAELSERTDMELKTIYVLGAGKGCGNHVAKRFGEEGFRVVLVSRSKEHLDEYAGEFADAGIEVHTRVLDVTDFEATTQALADLKGEVGAPDVLFCNVGVTSPDSNLRPGAKDAHLLMERYRTDVASAYNAIISIVDDDFCERRGAILVTGGGFALNPSPAFLPLSMDKAALRAMCLALHEELKERGVYVGTVTVTNAIAPGSSCDPALLAEDFWNLYAERSEAETVR